MPSRLLLLASCLLFFRTPPLAAAMPAACDATTLATLRAAAAGCDCTAAGHGAYVRCVITATKAAAKAAGAPRACEHEAKKCAARSTCGRSGAVACVTTRAAGTSKCAIKKDATACKAPKGATACAATEPSCCDASCGG